MADSISKRWVTGWLGSMRPMAKLPRRGQMVQMVTATAVRGKTTAAAPCPALPGLRSWNEGGRMTIEVSRTEPREKVLRDFDSDQSGRLALLWLRRAPFLLSRKLRPALAMIAMLPLRSCWGQLGSPALVPSAPTVDRCALSSVIGNKRIGRIVAVHMKPPLVVQV